MLPNDLVEFVVRKPGSRLDQHAAFNESGLWSGSGGLRGGRLGGAR